VTQKREQIEVSSRRQPISGKRGATIIGPTNPWREAENPDLLVPPRVDHGTVANLRWSFADSHMHLSEGGWGRQTTIRELPIATEVAGVNMRLTPGGVREMHWHKAAEWAYMIKGRARITAIDQEGRPFQDDAGEGDLWYFAATGGDLQANEVKTEIARMVFLSSRQTVPGGSIRKPACRNCCSGESSTMRMRKDVTWRSAEAELERALLSP